MSLRKLRMGTLGVSAETPDKKAVREARVKQARRHWQEIPAERLVARDRWLVDAEDDRLYQPYAGITFERSSARVIADQSKLWFYIDPSGEPVVIEPVAGKTWSQVYERRVRREAARR